MNETFRNTVVPCFLALFAALMMAPLIVCIFAGLSYFIRKQLRTARGRRRHLRSCCRAPGDGGAQ